VIVGAPEADTDEDNNNDVNANEVGNNAGLVYVYVFFGMANTY
jgi:hypothetical protein